MLTNVISFNCHCFVAEFDICWTPSNAEKNNRKWFSNISKKLWTTRAVKKRGKNCNGHIWNQRIKRHISTRPRKMRTKCLIRGQPNIAGATIVLYCATGHYLSWERVCRLRSRYLTRREAPGDELNMYVCEEIPTACMRETSRGGAPHRERFSAVCCWWRERNSSV